METLRSSPARALWLLLVSGIAMRLAWVAQTGGLSFDMESFRQVASALGAHPLQAYGELNPEGVYRWPYPPGYFPWVVVSDALAGAGLMSFRVAIVLPAVFADAALAWLVHLGLGRTGASDRARLAGAAVVMLGPVFALVSGFHGQIDALAILPAVAALLVWERGGPRRALVAGLLIGVGISIKTAPGLVLLALLPTVTSRREAGALVGAALALPLAALAPFLVADAAGVTRALGYGGIPGQGGITLLADPNLAHHWVENQPGVGPNGLVSFLSDHGGLITGAAVLAAAGLAWRRRLAPREAALLLWLTFYALGTGFAFQYAIWGLPFMLLAGRARWAIALQAGLVIPMLMFYAGPFKGPAFVAGYVVVMGIVWTGLAAAFAITARNGLRARVPA